ncbi:MAG: hypothetical protein EHM45_21865 [Desulfobacteraceae bacterium]|nr:MAG: hypothetical protein EHM45_21865 [Desulfobacteraceae bacterium]
MTSIKIKNIVFALVLCFILTGALVCNQQVRNFRKALPAENLRAEALMVNPNLLKILSGEFKGLLADYLLLKASVFRGGAWTMTDDDWRAMSMLFEQSLVLDPFFFQTGYYTQGILVWHKNTQAKAIELLEFHAKNRDWDWEPMFYVGFDYFYFLKNYDMAAQYMLESAKLPGAPPIVATLGARSAQRSGQTLTSMAMLNLLLERTENETDKRIFEKRLQAYLGIYKIEQALGEYVRRYNHYPNFLDDLIKTGILNHLPINPFGPNYLYDPITGQVFFDEMN